MQWWNRLNGGAVPASPCGSVDDGLDSLRSTGHMSAVKAAAPGSQWRANLWEYSIIISAVKHLGHDSN